MGFRPWMYLCTWRSAKGLDSPWQKRRFVHCRSSPQALAVLRASCCLTKAHALCPWAIREPSPKPPTNSTTTQNCVNALDKKDENMRSRSEERRVGHE